LIAPAEPNTNTSMNTIKTLKPFYLIALLSAIWVVTGFNKNDDTSSTSQKSKYDGDYSLYLSNSSQPEIKWITQVQDVGQYELYDSNNKLISKGKTELSRAHAIKVEQEIKRPFTLKYGGETSGMHEMLIRPADQGMAREIKSAENLYVLGDIHGRYDELINLLQKSKVVDEKLNWIANDAHLIFLGDLFDRGNDVTKVLWFIYQLEPKAIKAGGKVHVVLGNHEIMTMTKDLRYVSQKELSLGIAHKMTYDEFFHPTRSFLGNWLRSKPSLLKIDQIVFAHGGILELGNVSLKEFNTRAYDYMEDPIYLEIMKDYPDSLNYSPDRWNEMRNFFYHPESPYWYRGYVLSDTLMPELKSMLNKYQSKIHVVAHTPVESITERYKGLLLTTDLNEAATELLLLSKKKKKFARFKIDSQGIKTEL